MIYYVPHQFENQIVKEILIRHDLEWQYYDEWDFNTPYHFVLPKQGFVVMPWHTLDVIPDLEGFARAVGNSDCVFYLCDVYDNIPHYLTYSKYFANCDNVYYHLDGTLHNPDPRAVTTSEFSFMINIELPVKTDFTRKYDFVSFLTMHPCVPHRIALKNSLQANDLLGNAYTNFVYRDKLNHSDRDKLSEETRVGMRKNLLWADNHGLHVPWDIYDQCYMEVTGETFYDGFTCITQSTTRSLVYGFPSFIIADQWHYTRLDSHGFEFYNDIVDCSWHNLEHYEDRAQGIANSLLEVKDMGFKTFYEKTRSICKHNYRTLAATKQMQTLQHHNQFLDFYFSDNR